LNKQIFVYSTIYFKYIFGLAAGILISREFYRESIIA